MTDIHDIKTPLEISIIPTTLFLVILTLCSVFLLYLLIRKQKKREIDSPEQYERKEDHQSIAIQELDRLKANINSKDLRLLFHDLAICLKKYLKNIKHKNIVEMTAREIHHLFKNKEIDIVMNLCMEGEFKENPPKEENLKQAIELTYKIIYKF